MNLTKEKIGIWDVVAIDGSFVIRDQIRVKGIFDEYIKGGSTHLAIDLAKTNYLDSSALGLIVKTGKDFKMKNGRFLLFGPNETLQDMFHIVNLDSIIEIREKLPEE